MTICTGTLFLSESSCEGLWPTTGVKSIAQVDGQALSGELASAVVCFHSACVLPVLFRFLSVRVIDVRQC